MYDILAMENHSDEEKKISLNFSLAIVNMSHAGIFLGPFRAVVVLLKFKRYAMQRACTAVAKQLS
jgi:hypothetical protein